MSGRFVALAVIAGMLLAGCGSSGGAAPRTTPAVAATSTSSTSPVAPSTSPPPGPPTVPADVPTTGPNLKYRGEKPPVMPALATQHTRSGAVAFAEFFIRTIDWGYATTSSAYMRHYFADSCVACTSLASALDSAAAKHHRFIGDRISTPGDPDVTHNRTAYTATLSLNVESGEVVDQAGNFINGAPSLRQRVALSVEWSGRGWAIVDWAPVTS